MAPISIKIVLDDGAVTRKVKFETRATVAQAHEIIKDKAVVPDDGREYGLFLRSTDDDFTGIWLEKDRTLDYYMLRDGDSLDYICKLRNLRVKMLDETVKTLQVDQSKTVGDLMRGICARIGITNYDEYGLCHDEEDDQEESKDGKNTAQTGTLTLKRKAQERERDTELEELSKKLKTDDNVQWLDHHRTLRETGVDATETLLLKRRLYYSDRNVDSRDPVQLNLLYLQTRDAILNGKHPVTEEQAAEFAGIQCQIHFDDFQEDKHKPGFIENLSEYLPEQYAKSWGIEKKILKAHKKHIGVNQLEAKSLYIKTARDLPTYGVTFFLVKEKQKGKKKLVPRLLGINSESILRLDEVTKEILQVWPLTHVKTYQAGKSETFTLNFGDYSEKEYSVKTRDAHRIRDILEGYIDIIRKRMLAKGSNTGNEGIIIYQDNVEASKGNVIQMVSNNPQKLISECFIEAQHLMSKKPEQVVQGGAQVVNMHQIVVADQVNKQQQAVKGEVPMRADMPMDCVRRLNRLNTMSVSIVTLLTSPNEQNVREVQRTVDTMNREIMPVLNDGLKKTAEKQSTEEAKQKMLNDLQDLSEYVKTLTESTATGNVNPHEAENAAKNIADLTTQMYFSMDPRTKRRSDLLNRSRKSFKEDERIDSSLRRASFIAAASTALHVLDDADRDIYQTYKGPALNKKEIEEREREAADKIGKLNAAVALYLTAHSDPKVIDYGTAVNSMNTIKELVPELVQDAQAIGNAKDGNPRQQLLDDLRGVFDSIKKVCTVTGSDDHEKMQEASSKYADASRKLLFTLGHGASPEKEHEIIELAKAVGDHTSALVMTANEFRVHADDSTAKDIEKAEAHALNCAKDLLACAQVTGGRSGQAVCVGALAAASEAVSGAAQRVMSSCRSMLHAPAHHDRAQELRARATTLAEALDALNNSCNRLPDPEHALMNVKATRSSVNDQVIERKRDIDKDYGDIGDCATSPQELQRLKFIKTSSGVKNRLQAANAELDKANIYTLVSKEDGKKLQEQLSQKLARLNAAIASLLTATSDRENPDYVTAELAANTIGEMLTDLLNDAKTLSSTKDPAECKAFLDEIRALSEASQAICANAGIDNQGLNDSIANYTDASGKLTFMFKPMRKVDSAKEQEILDLSAGACGTASQLLASVQHLAVQSDAETRQELDTKGGKVADAAQALLTAAQVTGPSISEPRCQSALLTSVDGLASSSQQLSHSWRQVSNNPQKATLEKELRELEDMLDKIRKACQDIPAGDKETLGDQKSSPQEGQRLKFINTVSGVKKRFDSAEDELNKPYICSLMREKDGVQLQEQLSQKMAQLNAAIASLLRATSDRKNPDYTTAEEAVKTISTLLPYFVKDAKTLSGTKDPVECQSLMDQLHALCDASKAICTGAGSDNEDLNDSINKFTDASGKLVYVFKPTRKVDVDKGQEVLGLSAGACGKASQLLANVQQVAVQLDGDVGQDLDCRGAKVADAAQSLLTTAQITAPSISEPQCQSALLSSVNAVSSSSDHLADGWRQLPTNPQRQTLEREHKELEDMLNKIRMTCQNISTGDKKLVETQKLSPQENQRLKFINTVSGVKKQLDAVDQELKKPYTCSLMREKDGVKLQKQLSQKMAQLNAAIASLLRATSDRTNPDYTTAEEAVTTISTLLPYFVKDAKTLSGTKNPVECQSLMDQLNALCDASKAICTGAGSDNEGLNDSINKFTDASGKLVYVFKPTRKADVDKGQEILGLSAGACEKASQLLGNVQQVAVQLDGDVGQDLDCRGAKVADAAQSLLTTAQITAPCISEPQCQSTLLSSVNAVSLSSDHLADGWRQLPTNPQRQTLKREQKELEDMLNKIRKACRDISTDDKKVAEVQKLSPQENQRLKFINTVSGAKKQLDAVDQELNKPDICAFMKEEDGAKLHEELSHKLAHLNAAIASLLTATSGRMEPDYIAAERAVSDISHLLPEFVRDAKVLSSTKEPAECKAFLDNVHAISEASKSLCASAGGDDKNLNDTVAKFADASGKLVYVFKPIQKEEVDKEKEILDLSAAACAKTSQLLTNVQQATVQMDGDMGQELDIRGARVADAAQTLLTTSQITAPTILEPRCKSSLLTAVDALSSTSHQLADDWRKLPSNHQRQMLETEQSELEDLLDKIRHACRSTPKRKLATLVSQAPSPKETERLTFINTMAQAQKWLYAADDELNKPAPSKRIGKQESVQLKEQLSQKLAQMNAAIGSLLTATSNRSDPDYATAEEAVDVVTLLLPDVIKDSKALSTTMEPAERKVVLDQIRSLCDASKAICGNVGLQNKELNDSAEQYAAASGNLSHVFKPPRKVDADKEREIVGLSAGACGAASQLLASIQQVAVQSDANTRQELDSEGTKVADAAQALLSAAQVTAPSISDPQCQSVLLSSVDGLSSASQLLSRAWSKLPDNHQRRALETELQRLEDMLNKLRKSCLDMPTDGPSGVKKKLAVAAKTVAHSTHSKAKNADLAQEFLENIRLDETSGQSPAQIAQTLSTTTKTKPVPPPKPVDDKEKRLRQQYIQSIEDAEKSIQKAAYDLKNLITHEHKSVLGRPVNPSEAVTIQDRIEDKLALAGVEVASLITANHAEKMDYPNACKSITTLPQLMSSIVEDGKSFSASLNDEERKLFLDDILRLCDASAKLCDSAKKDKEKVKDAAIVFGNESSKLLYFVSTDADAALQKEIIHRAKEIGDSASRLAVQATHVSADASSREGESRVTWEAVWAAGIDTVNAATNLLYTAKLVSPSIYNPTCQNALTTSADGLSGYLKKFSDSWKSQCSDPQQAKSFEELARETDNLEKLVQELKGEVIGGPMSQQRELDNIVVEDTPLRNMTCKIMDDAKKTSECMDLPATLRNKYTEYAKQLSAALTEADLATHASRRAPQDTVKRRALENAIQNLQTVILQYRPEREGQKQSNIVDLTDFIQDVSTEADKLLERANEVKAAKGQSKIEDIKEHCYKINENAFKLMNPDQDDVVETSLDGLLQMDHFAQDCESRAEQIKLTSDKIEDEKAKGELQPRVHQLSENCDLLRFATRSALSGAQSASLDETLNDLDDLETRVIKTLVPDNGSEAVVTRKQNVGGLSAEPWTRSKLAGAVAGAAGSADSQPLPAAFTAYATQLACRAQNALPEERDRLLKHLNKLVHQLKSLTVITSKRVAMWQPVNHPEVAVITEQILQELENPEIDLAAKSKPRHKLLNAQDANKLLLPNESLKISGDKKELEEKLGQMGGKLMMMSSNIVQSVGKPESLSRSVVATLDCAKNLAALARSLKNNQNPIQNKKIEESALEMSYATYHLLQTSEYVSQDPENPECRRRLLEALRQLNDSVNKLVRTACLGRSLQRECEELSRGLQVQQSAALGAGRPHCALPYAACIDALASQQDVIDKLKSDKKMPRDEFAKSLHYVTSSVANSAEYAAQCAYLISISEKNKEVAKEGLVDRQKIQRAIGSMQDTCMTIMRSGHVEDAKEEKPKLQEQLQILTQTLEEATGKAGEESVKKQLKQCERDVGTAANTLSKSLDENCTKEKLTPVTMKLIGALHSTSSVIDQPSLVPQASNMTTETKTRVDEIMDHSRALITKTQALIKDVKSAPEDEDMMTWVMFNNRNKVLEVFDALLKSVQLNGQRAGILDGGAADSEEELGGANKSNVQLQLETANKWLQNPICKPDKRTAGEEATKKVIDFAKQMCEDMKEGEKEEVQQLIEETEQLFKDCVVIRDNTKSGALKDRLRELKKAIERGMVIRVVEDLIEEEAPLEDLEILVDTEKDAAKRNYLLEKKIAELLAQLGRVTKTARFVADAGSGSPTVNRDLIQCSEQTELLAPLLVKAAQERINKPNDVAVVDNYKALLAKYAESLSKVRELCDVAVDPMDFVQTAGETMERIREESSQHNDPQKCAKTSYTITKLANRVINVGISSRSARTDPELQQALSAAQQRLRDAQPQPGARASRLPHWKDTTAEILRATGEVESVMGGENIFKKRPHSDEPIFSVAMDLHASVREWSSRDNEIVAVAKRVAVLMAKLSDYMNTDKQKELIVTSKSIVEESHEVAYLARKLATECSDIRIKTNLLKTCERIPTISAQLKMLTTVKGSSLGHQGMEEDKEAMDMLVGNAQSLMLSIQEVVKAAASASVKIMSQRGPRMKWVRKNYYY